MSRGNRRLLPGALPPMLGLIMVASCFSPVGSAASTTDSDTSTTQAPSTTTITTGTTLTTVTTGTSDETQSTGGDTSTTTSTSSDTTASDVTSSTGSSTTGPGFCGDAIIQPGEACDDGAANGDEQPCRNDCVLGVCGDGVLCSGCVAPETCDDGNQIADDACDLECQTTTCGNGVQDQGEECDDGNEIVGDGCGPRCLVEQQFVFVSSLKLNGDFNGLAAADQLCAGLAAPHFNLRRKFVAWLSDADADAATRIAVSNFAYKTPKGVLIASNTQDLLDGSIAAPILENEEGMAQAPGGPCDGNSGVWTGTIAMGEGVSDTCGDWHSLEGLGLAGNFGVVDGKWSQACSLPCSTLLRVYCIEKAH